MEILACRCDYSTPPTIYGAQPILCAGQLQRFPALVTFLFAMHGLIRFRLRVGDRQ